jgi:arsenical pump membrane protein
MAISVVTASVICLISQRKKVTPVYEAIKKMPFEIIPFILGMFVIVLALDTTGTTEFFASKLTFDKSAFSFGFLSLFGSNILNNIPMSVLFSKLLAFYGTEAQIYATIVGSNIGAFITPVGALAGIMWSNLLRQNKIHISVARFICYGSLIGIPAMAISLIILEIIM